VRTTRHQNKFDHPFLSITFLQYSGLVSWFLPKVPGCGGEELIQRVMLQTLLNQSR
jgi:hypothetical protein